MSQYSSEIIKICEDIDEVLYMHAVPTPNDYAVRRIEFLVQQLPSGYAREKGKQLAFYARDYYSARKHLSIRGGADLLHAKMRELLNRIRGLAERETSTEE